MAWAAGRTTDAELARLAEELVARDEDSAVGKVDLTLGCSTRTGNRRDCSPLPLFKRQVSLRRKPHIQG